MKDLTFKDYATDLAKDIQRTTFDGHKIALASLIMNMAIELDRLQKLHHPSNSEMYQPYHASE